MAAERGRLRRAGLVLTGVENPVQSASIESQLKEAALSIKTRDTVMDQYYPPRH
jgi:hypothetical protein